MVSIHNITGVKAEYGSIAPRSWVQLTFTFYSGNPQTLTLFFESPNYHRPTDERSAEVDRLVVDLTYVINSVDPVPVLPKPTEEAA